jgi:hypothetical protein
MPIIRGAASDFTTYQKNNAQSTAVPFRYSRVGQPPIARSISSAQALASKVSLTASSRTVASFIINTRGRSTGTGGADQSKSSLFPGVPRYFLD